MSIFENSPLLRQVRDAVRNGLWRSGLILAMAGSASGLHAAENAGGPAPTAKPVAAPAQPQIYIQEYRVLGSHRLPQIEVEEAVYPYLGPGRTGDDVEHARAALEKAFRDKGYQTVSVQVPRQDPSRGVVMLQVIEGKVARLRVKGARYFSLDEVKKEAPSLAEGQVLDFNKVQKEITALNQSADRQVTPALRAGEVPGTVDIDLNVKDTPPLHGSLELNNRYSADTTPLRVNGSVSYDNLLQLGQTIGGSFQVAPENVSQVNVFSGYYSAPVPTVSWLSLMMQGTKQDSNVSTLGGADSSGRGEIIGARAIISLPAGKDFYHSLSLGLDYKHFDQGLTISGTDTTTTPTDYCPLSASYSASWVAKGQLTELNASANLALRGIAGSEVSFDNSRYQADGNYIYFRGDIAHTQDLPAGFQVYGKVQGQAADQPLLSSEQFSAGGLSTVRGYLESEAMGDNALFGTLELRTPSLGTWLGTRVNEWRFYVFSDAGQVDINNVLPGQQSAFSLASYGVGSQVKFRDHFNGSLDLGVPLIGLDETSVHSVLFTFRLWAEF
jgi:hemolysin activation/secretion protein